MHPLAIWGLVILGLLLTFAIIGIITSRRNPALRQWVDWWLWESKKEKKK